MPMGNDAAGWRVSQQGPAECSSYLRFTAQEDMNAVGAVGHTAMELPTSRQSANRWPKPDPLDSSADMDMKEGHTLCVRLV